MRLQGMLPAKSTAGVTAVQMGRSGRQRRHLLWFWDTRSDYTLVALLIVILNKDEVVSCRTKHNKTVESAKMGTRAKISDELRGGGGLFLCGSVCDGAGMSRGSGRVFSSLVFLWSYGAVSLSLIPERAVWLRRASDWSGHFSLEGPAVSTVGLRATLSPFP